MKPRKMKDSGIPWIGEIPEGWEVRRLKRSCNLLVEKCPSRGDEVSDGLTYLGLEHIESQFGRLVGDYRHILDFSGDAIRFWKGNVLFGKLRPYLAKCWVSDIDGKCSSEFFVLAPNDSFCGKYLQWTMLSNRFIDLVDGSTFGVKMPRAEWNFVGGIQMPCPKSDEQARIAAYLDEKCGEIDRVIAAKERQNELLRDQRAAVIHEAVTKGLNPKAKFKESGYEWIGKIPADWTLDKIKWLGKAIIGLTYSPEEVASNGTLVLRASNIQGGQVVYDDNVYVRKEIPDEIVLRKDDILICSRNGSRALIGKCALIDEKVAGQTFGAFMTVLRSPANRYLFHVLNSQLFSFYLSAFLTSTINQLTTENLNNMVVPMPKTPAEQQQIAAHLDARCGEIDRVMAANEGMVAKLKEYRASLIWEAVTGKKCL